MKRLLVLLTAGLLAATLAAPAALATTTKTPITGTNTIEKVTFPGVETLHETIASVRGETDVESMTGPDLVASETSVANWNYDLATGTGVLWGTSQIYDVTTPSAPGGGYNCTWNGTFVPATGGWTGKAVCHGYGTLTGWQSRVDMVSVYGENGHTWSGYGFLPGN